MISTLPSSAPTSSSHQRRADSEQRYKENHRSESVRRPGFRSQLRQVLAVLLGQEQLPSLSCFLASALPSGGYRERCIQMHLGMGNAFVLCCSADQGPRVLILKRWLARIGGRVALEPPGQMHVVDLQSKMGQGVCPCTARLWITWLPSAGGGIGAAACQPPQAEAPSPGLCPPGLTSFPCQ